MALCATVYRPHEMKIGLGDRAVEMQTFKPLNPNYEAELRQGFARQQVMEKIGAYLISIEPGWVEIGLNFREDLTQQHGSRPGSIPTGATGVDQ